MSVEDYKYVEGRPSKQPIWGTEMSLIAMKKKKGRYAKITVTTSRFYPSPENSTGMLTGNRTIWEIDDELMKAKIIGIQHWTAEIGHWYDHAMPVPARHRLVLANYLMGRWNKGKLRGRIDDNM